MQITTDFTASQISQMPCPITLKVSRGKKKKIIFFQNTTQEKFLIEQSDVKIRWNGLIELIMEGTYNLNHGMTTIVPSCHLSQKALDRLSDRAKILAKTGLCLSLC